MNWPDVIDSDFTIIVPAYNESLRIRKTIAALDAHYRRKQFEPFHLKEVIIVDDGSTDNTAEIAQAECQGRFPFRIIRDPQNMGKGAAVRRGILAATTTWVLISDADVIETWGDVKEFAQTCLKHGYDIAMGTREKNHVVTFRRKKLGRVFNAFVRLVTRLPHRDTQCGFKVFRRRAVEPLFRTMRIEGFAWDVELLMLGQRAGLRMISIPVTWIHDTESKVRVVGDGLRMLCDVLTIRFRMAVQG